MLNILILEEDYESLQAHGYSIEEENDMLSIRNLSTGQKVLEIIWRKKSLIVLTKEEIITCKFISAITVTSTGLCIYAEWNKCLLKVPD